MKKAVWAALAIVICTECSAWGFYGHRKINYCAVFLLPPSLLRFYKPHLAYLSEHAVDPDKRRYAVAEEGPRHYIDMDRYGSPPWDSLPRRWDQALEKYGPDTLQARGIVPWWIQTMLYRLTQAFKDGNASRILKLSAELGHYIADAHVPLHTSSNHNGQLSGQRGIHGFWESRLPELMAEKEWDFIIGKAFYITDPLQFTWDRVLQSAMAADSVLLFEKKLTERFPPAQKYAFEERNGKITRQYASAFCREYDRALGGMTERRMRQSIEAVASFWYTAWLHAGQPPPPAGEGSITPDDVMELEALDAAWRKGKIIGRREEED